MGTNYETVTRQIAECEQWKLNGNCEKCRRKEYCHTACAAQKRRKERAMKNAVNSVVDRLFTPFGGITIYHW